MVPPIDPGAAAAESAPRMLSMQTVDITETSAGVSYNSDQCVATQFTLTGSDGSVQQGSSPGFNPDVSCALGWRLDFIGRNGLEPETDYVLSVTIKARSNDATTTAQISFSTED